MEEKDVDVPDEQYECGYIDGHKEGYDEGYSIGFMHGRDSAPKPYPKED
jgi:flagellar biosynthesis/type III secretory pathway protein FliH